MQAATTTSPSKQTVLIVDDHEGDRALFSYLIVNSKLASQFDILESESCEDALTLLETIMPVCCLVDYHLPLDSGMDFLKAIRRMEFSKRIPVIIMTGEGDEQLAVEIMRNGAQDYLVKGDLTSNVIIQSINNAIHTCDLQDKLNHLAHYDSLTGLLNRSLFMDRMQMAIDQCDRYKQSCSLLFIDIDNFKQINDQYGHYAGDMLLQSVGNRIRKNCRLTDSTARLGGDEFAILLTHSDEIHTQETAEKILRLVSEPVLFESANIQISLSIGIAHYPDTASSIHDLMRQSDEAMYRAKKTGKAQYVQFTQEQKELWERRTYLEGLLPKALENNELKLAFQPIVETQSEKLHCLEVLVRWFPANHTIFATELVEMIERLGLFDPFHVWLINASLQQLHRWQKTCPDLHCCINIPANQCHSDLIVDSLRKAMKTYNITPDQIELEITETTLMKHPSISSKLLSSMQMEGVRIAVDDFGSGYSSLAYLTTLPLDTLKIDQRFFTDVEGDVRNRKVIEAVTALGHSLGLKVVAEGVETLGQYQLAKEVGCDFVQGYFFARPQLGVKDWADFIKQFPRLKLNSPPNNEGGGGEA